jgi:lipid-binding SYLF domain-containing protein
MKRNMTLLAMVGALAMLAAGCSTEPDTASGRASLDNDTGQALSRMQTEDPGLQDVLNHAYAYAVFPTVGKGAIGVGGAYGHGEVFQGGNMVGYTDMTQATIGAQLGGESYSELLVFQDQNALNNFEQGQFAFAADASAVALKSGAAAAAPYKNGVAVFVSPIGGAMLEAAIGGQSFSYQPK